ncbi:hypothetical protein Btru_038820 [Bulinus truncatus]|nr:hypothetical protein Btru_038820 [Bulinus truncatus]
MLNVVPFNILELMLNVVPFNILELMLNVVPFNILELSYIHQKTVLPCILTERTLLQAKVSSRQTLLIKLNTQNAEELEYMPGDLVGVYPMNSPMLVDGIMRKLENSPLSDQVIQVEFLDTESQGPIKRWVPFEKLPPCSLRLALTHFIDLVTPPSQSLLHMLSKLANIGNDKEKLALLATNIDAYEEWKTSIYPNFLEVMNLFPSLKTPAALLLTELPIMHERYYCISSDPAIEVGDLHITVAVLKYRNTGNLREGVCSGWLNSCDIGTMAPCLIRKNKNFYLPSNKSLPVLMIAAGKGIAPFRSFWQHRVVEQEYFSKAAEDEREILGDMTLFFGCRSSALDNIYGKELKSMEKNGVLSFYLAYSKEPNLSKMYVQELLKRRASQVVDIIINKEGHVYVSGDTVKVNDITTALEELLSVDGMMSPTDATKFLWHLKDTGVFHEIIYGFDRKVPESQLIQTLSINTSLTAIDLEMANKEQV